MEIPLLKIFLVSAVVMGLSHTIAREKIFEPLRTRCGGMSTWRGYLLSCPYCASHWLAFVLVPLTGAYGVRMAYHWPLVTPILDWFFSSILVTVIAAILRVGFYFIDENQGLLRRKEKREDLALQREKKKAA